MDGADEGRIMDDKMWKVIDRIKLAFHGVFHMERAGGAPKQADEEHQPSCFALEEEKGGNWKGTGAARPAINESRPTL
jgi:hypothetical protein